MSTDFSENRETKSYKRWTFCTLLLTAAVFIMTAAVTVYKDPFFHYHAPLPQYTYPQKVYPDSSERYCNDGISRHFSYEGIITGTSMSENFKASEADALFDSDFIKVPYAGATYREISDNLRRAYQAGKEVRYVIWGLDYNNLISDKDACNEDFPYPYHLYNNNPFDDISYVLNKSVLLGETMRVTKAEDGNGSAVDFDTYGSWSVYHGAEFGAWHVLTTYGLKETPESPKPLTEEQQILLLDNLRQNVSDLAAEHSETTFYLFIPPYSICYWDILNNEGTMDQHIDAEKLAIEELLQYSNIKLYSFSDNFELTCDLDNYKDYMHYGEWVNSRILEWMKEEEHLLTQDNYTDYLERIREFYHSYDYASLHE